MKAAQIDKLYPKLDNYQLSALAFEALMRGDDAEKEAILGSVRELNYRCKDQRFTRRYRGYLDLALFYGMVYWKERTFMAVAETRYKEDGCEKSRATLYHFVDNVVAMDVALQAVCTDVNIDYMAVKKLAQCGNEHSPDKCSDGELVQEYVALFNNFIN